MKQGRAKNTYEPKTEPVSKAVNPGYAAQLGNHVGEARAVEQMYQGRGYEAPKPTSDTRHKAGSQGRH